MKSKVKLKNPKEHRKEIYGDGIGHVEYVEHMGNDLKIVNSARVSFGVHREEMRKKDEKLISYLCHNGHTSTLEHNIVTFRCKVPLFVRSQHHRHRTFSFNEVSRRYTQTNIEFYEPLTFRRQHEKNRQASIDEKQINPSLGTYSSRDARSLIKSHHRMSLNLYNELMKAGVCREQARGVLPQNIYTEYYATANLNNLFKFIRLRYKEDAQWEIRVVAKSILEFLEEIYPVATKSFKENIVNV